jgi:hypothetical protein
MNCVPCHSGEHCANRPQVHRDPVDNEECIAARFIQPTYLAFGG